MNTPQYKLISERKAQKNHLTWADMYAIFNRGLFHGSVIHRIQEDLGCEPEEDLSTFMLDFQWCTEQEITPDTTGVVAVWELFSWTVVMVMLGEHHLDL